MVFGWCDTHLCKFKVLSNDITISLVFFDSLWIKTNKGLTRALVGEIVTIIDIYNNESEYNKKIVTDLYNKNFSFSVRFLDNEKLLYFCPRKLQNSLPIYLGGKNIVAGFIPGLD